MDSPCRKRRRLQKKEKPTKKAKKTRCEKQEAKAARPKKHRFRRLAPHIVRHVASFLEPEQVATLGRTCKRVCRHVVQSSKLWKDLSIAHGEDKKLMTDTWKSLRGDKESTEQQDAALWRQILLSRIRSSKNFMKDAVDFYPSTYFIEEDEYGGDVHSLTFTIFVWRRNSPPLTESVTGRFERTKKGFSSELFLEVKNAEMQQWFSSPEGFDAVEINVSCRNGTGRPALLYSNYGKGQMLPRYGGHEYEEYSLLRWIGFTLI